MAVVGVLVEAQVGHDDQVVADLVLDVLEGSLGDALGRPRLGALGVLGVRLGNPEEDDAGDAQVSEGPDLLAQGLPGVLDHARH